MYIGKFSTPGILTACATGTMGNLLDKTPKKFYRLNPLGKRE